MNIKKLREIVKKNDNITQVCREYYGNLHYGNRQTLKKYIEEYCIDVSHFGNNKIKFNLSRFNKTNIEDILVEHSTYNTTNLKKRLYKEGLKKPICEMCGQDEWWYGKKMSLILDHINGINDDHRIENLRIVCPNCNATLPTHCKGTKKIKTKTKIPRSVISENQRKVKRPPYKQLINEINELGYLGTGRKYGVSDNAIRKWKKFYEKYNKS